MRSMITSYSRGSSWRVPPSLTYSATTSASRRLTSSMNAGGKDHSRPTMSPTFAIMLFVLQSIVASDVLPDHALPVRPVVRPAVPDAKGVRDSLVPERAGKLLVIPIHGIVPPDRHDDVDPADRLQPTVVALVAHEVGRVGVVDIGVGVALGHSADVVHAAEAKHPADKVRMPEREGNGVVCAEARAGGDDELILVAPPGEGHHLALDVRIVLRVAVRPLGGMAVLRVPALTVHAVHAEELKP